MVEKLREYLMRLEGKAVTVNYSGLLSGLKWFKCLEVDENENYIILSEMYDEDRLYIRKDEFEFSEELFEGRVIGDNMVFSIGVS